VRLALAIAMEYSTTPLTDNYKNKVHALFIKEWPQKPESDFEISWEGRDASSIAILSRDNFLGFVITSYHPSTGDNLYIDYIALASECKGYGIGSKVLKKYVAKAFNKKSSVHLWPDKDELVGWYERNGFRHTNDGYYNFHSYETRRQNKIHKSLGLY
jgi:ribosomal protein S18 acetylase RimI-like enzyme